MTVLPVILYMSSIKMILFSARFISSDILSVANAFDSLQQITDLRMAVVFLIGFSLLKYHEMSLK